jgi:FkbM family methyltransferase
MNIFQRKFQAVIEILYFNNWLPVLIERLMNVRLSVYKKDGLYFVNDYKGGDTAGARHLLVNKLYEEFVKIILDDQKEVKVVLDIGANNGGFILSLLQKQVSINQIVAIEFNYRTYIRLHFNLLYNLNRNVKVDVVNIAASGKDKLIYTTDNWGSTGFNIYDKDLNQEQLYKVQGCSFDTIYAKYLDGLVIDICKIDIEGAEYELFYSEHITKVVLVRYLIIEIHTFSNHKKVDFINRVLELGFELILAGNKISPDVYLFKNKNMK